MTRFARLAICDLLSALDRGVTLTECKAQLRKVASHHALAMDAAMAARTKRTFDKAIRDAIRATDAAQ